MLRSTLISLALVVFSLSASAFDNTMLSCSFGGFEGIESVELKNTVRHTVVDVTTVDGALYSLPMIGRSMTNIDLSGFNIFNELSNPRLVQQDARWFFLSDTFIHEVGCAQP